MNDIVPILSGHQTLTFREKPTEKFF